MDNRIELAKCIEEAFKEEFRIYNYSGNLINTMSVNVVDDNVTIDIPAQTYDMLEYKMKKIIKYTNKGSYAEQVNKTGGFSGMHVGFIERCIEKGIQKWLDQNGLSGRVSMNE